MTYCGSLTQAMDSCNLRLVSLFVFSIIVSAVSADSNATSGWTYGRTSRTGQSWKFLRRQAGSVLDLSNATREPHLTPPSFDNHVDIDSSFDARVAWPNCQSMQRILDQGRCGCCWATAGAGVISDRLCIASKDQNLDVQISVQDPLVCSGGSDNLCNDAFPKIVYEMYVDKGLVTGGGYESKKGCMPYEAFTQQETESTSSLNCPNACTNSNYKKSYKKDKFYGSKWYAMGNHFSSDSSLDKVIQQIQIELITKGPITATLIVYDDFFGYVSGVYRHSGGKLIAGHAMKLMGWGTEDGKDYWLLANSWGTDWGIGGFVKFVRGENHLGIENYLVTAIPL